MNRKEFLETIAGRGWHAHNLNATWIQICRQMDYSSSKDGPINPMGLIEIVLTPEGQINLLLPSPFIGLCPGVPGQLRHFRVVAADWQDAFSLVETIYQAFGSQWEPDNQTIKRPFENFVVLIPARRLIPDDYTFYFSNRGAQQIEPNSTAYEENESV
jgi:hypothetical protein